jgi:hypothetical protein
MERIFSVGDVVQSQTFGEGVVDKILPDMVYCLVVLFQNHKIYFTSKGRYVVHSISPSLDIT